MKQGKTIVPMLLSAGLLLGGLLLTKEAISAYKTASSGTANSRVAGFHCLITSLSQTSEDNLLDLTQTSDMVTYSFMIQNNSEVDVTFSLEVQNVPAGVQTALGEDNGTLDKNGGSRTVSLTVQVPDPDNPPAEDTISGMRIVGNFTQID